MRTIALVSIFLVLAAAAPAEEPPIVKPDDVPAVVGRGSFQAVDVWIDAGALPLAAYQVEVRYDAARVKVVGVEGGDRGAFNAAPYHDPAGKAGGRIVVASFTTEDARAPAGRVRVARLHLRVEGGGDPEVTIRLVTAAQAGGERIQPEVALTPASDARGE